MWFPSSDIFLNINLLYKDNNIFTPLVHTQSKQPVALGYSVDEPNQNLQIQITVPELLYIEFKNITKTVLVDQILIDDIPIEQKNFKEVVKFCPNPNNLSIDAIDKLPKKISYEKNLNSALKKINGYNIDSISLDLNNIAIKNYDHIKCC